MPNPELTEIFGASFARNVENAIGQLTPEVEELLVNVSNQMNISATVFGQKLNKQAGMLVNNGLSLEAVKSNLSKDMQEGGAIFGELRNAIKGDLAEATNQAGRIGQLMEQGEEELFYWITVGGHRVCPDCDGRAGEAPQPYSYWVENGLPGTGWSVCQGWCYCVLDPTGKLPTKVTMPAKIAEKQATKPKIPITRTNKYPNKKIHTSYPKLKKDSEKFFKAESELHRKEVGEWSVRQHEYVQSIQNKPRSERKKLLNKWNDENPAPVGVRAAYRSYYTSGYRHINRYLRDGSFDKHSSALFHKKVKTWTKIMKDNFDNQPGYSGTVWRGTGVPNKADYLNRLKVYEQNKGNIITDKMFISSSTRKEFANGWGTTEKFRIEFTIKSKTGVSPNGLEMSASEAEVLFNSNTQFKVIDVIKKSNEFRSPLGANAGLGKWDEVAHVILEEI